MTQTMKAEEIKRVLGELAERRIRDELLIGLRGTHDRLGALNGPYGSGPPLKNLLLRPLNALNRKQFAINEYLGRSGEIISDEIGTRLNEDLGTRHPQGTPRLTVFVPFDFRPANFGGAARVFNLYNNLSRRFVVNAVAIADYGVKSEAKAYNENFTVHVVPHSKEYADLKETEEGRARGRLHDILLIDRYPLIPELVETATRLSYHTDCVVACHPFTFDMLAEAYRNALLVYEAHDIEADIKESYFAEENAVNRAYLEKVRNAEERACRESDVIFSVSDEDSRYMQENFGVEADKIVLAENGVDTRKSTFTSPAGRRSLKRMLGIDKPVVIFVGSDHGPNVEAADFIIEELAPRDKNIEYAIGGSIIWHYKAGGARKTIPGNVRFLGVLSEGEKEALYAIGDLAVNPIFSGSGTNLKIFDYGAHGLPVVSTGFGIRGAPELAECVIVSERGAFLDAIRGVLQKSEVELREMTETCRRIVEDTYDWKVISGRMGRTIAGLLNDRKGAAERRR